jgi:hypothetical protein
MSAAILPFPQAEDETTLWDRYVSLVNEMNANPNLANDMRHSAERHRAHQRFLQVFGGQNAKAG